MEAFLHDMKFKHVSHRALNSFHKRFMGVLVVNLFIKSEEKFKIWLETEIFSSLGFSQCLSTLNALVMVVVILNCC